MYACMKDPDSLFSFLTQCYYLHTMRELVSPVFGIFFLFIQITRKYIFILIIYIKKIIIIISVCGRPAQSSLTFGNHWFHSSRPMQKTVIGWKFQRIQLHQHSLVLKYWGAVLLYYHSTALLQYMHHLPSVLILYPSTVLLQYCPCTIQYCISVLLHYCRTVVLYY